MFKPWSEYRIGTKAISSGGGYWIKSIRGWKWSNGSTFPTPGGDVCDVIEPKLYLDCAHSEDTEKEICSLGSDRYGCEKFHHMDWLEEDMILVS